MCGGFNEPSPCIVPMYNSVMFKSFFVRSFIQRTSILYEIHCTFQNSFPLSLVSALCENKFAENLEHSVHNQWNVNVTSVLLAIEADKTLTTQTRAYAPLTPKGSEAHHIS